MKRQIAIILITIYSSLNAQTQIAVTNFAANGVSNQETIALTNRLMVELFRTSKFTILEREMLSQILDEQKFQMSGCTSNECLVQIGQLANVQQIVGGNISKVGNVFSITSRLIDVESGRVVATALYDYRGDIGELMIQGMSIIAEQLSGQDAPAPSKEPFKPMVSPSNSAIVNTVSKPPIEHTPANRNTLPKEVNSPTESQAKSASPSSGYSMGIMLGYPVYMSAGFFLGKGAPVYSAIFSTPFGFSFGPVEFGLGAKIGMYDFSDEGEYSGLMILGTLNAAVYESTRGPVSIELGGGYYGASIGVTSGLNYSYRILGAPLVVNPYLRTNTALSSGMNDMGSLTWISVGLYLSYIF
jgi:TolB-like protein